MKNEKELKGVPEKLERTQKELFDPDSILDEYQKFKCIKEHPNRLKLSIGSSVGAGIIGAYLGKVFLPATSELEKHINAWGSTILGMLGVFYGYLGILYYLNNRKLKKFMEECKERGIDMLYEVSIPFSLPLGSRTRYSTALSLTYLALDQKSKEAIVYKGEDVPFSLHSRIRNKLANEFEIQDLSLPKKDLDRLIEALKK